jgi:hypothetical protein
MKTMFLLVLVVVGLTFTSAFAGEALINDEGQVRVEEPSPWRPLNFFELQAYQNPGVEVPLWSASRRVSARFFHIGLAKVATNVVVYDDGVIKYAPAERKETRYVFHWCRGWIIIAMLLMIGSVIACKKGETNIATALAISSAFASVLGIAFTAVFAPPAATFIHTIIFAAAAIILAAIVAVASEMKDKPLYWIFAWVFYMCAIVVMVG